MTDFDDLQNEELVFKEKHGNTILYLPLTYTQLKKLKSVAISVSDNSWNDIIASIDDAKKNINNDDSDVVRQLIRLYRLINKELLGDNSSLASNKYIMNTGVVQAICSIIESATNVIESDEWMEKRLPEVEDQKWMKQAKKGDNYALFSLSG